MTFDSRRDKDLQSMYNAVTAREGLVFALPVILEDEQGNQTNVTVIQSDPFDPKGAVRSQRRTFRMLEAVTVKRNYKIIQTTNNETAYWWVKDIQHDNEGTLYVKCERPIAKG